MHHRLSHLLTEIFLPSTCRQATHLIAISQSTATDLKTEYQINPQKISVIYEGANIRFFQTDSLNWLSAVNMAQLIKKARVSLVHAHATFAGSIISSLAGKLAGVPVIIHAHLQDAVSSNSLIRSYQNIMNYWTSRKCCDAIIAVFLPNFLEYYQNVFE